LNANVIVAGSVGSVVKIWLSRRETPVDLGEEALDLLLDVEVRTGQRAGLVEVVAEDETGVGRERRAEGGRMPRVVPGVVAHMHVGERRVEPAGGTALLQRSSRHRRAEVEARGHHQRDCERRDERDDPEARMHLRQTSITGRT